MTRHIDIDKNSLDDFCQRHGLSRLSLFGSVLREDFDPDRSDIDVLVEFLPGSDRSLFAFVRMQDQLSELFARRVHVCTPGSLSRYFRDEVLAEAEEQYVAA